MIVMFNMKKVAGTKKYMYQTAAKYNKILNNYFKPWMVMRWDLNHKLWAKLTFELRYAWKQVHSEDQFHLCMPKYARV
jgi:hypothetical protein